MLAALPLDLHDEVLRITILERQGEEFADSIPAVQDKQCRRVSAGLVDAFRLEGHQPFDLLWGESGQNLPLFLQAWDLDASPSPVQEGVDAAQPGVDDSMIRCLRPVSDSSAPSKALKAPPYHARVLGVTFLRYFRSCTNAETVPLIKASFSQVIENMGG